MDEARVPCLSKEFVGSLESVSFLNRFNSACVHCVQNGGGDSARVREMPRLVLPNEPEQLLQLATRIEKPDPHLQGCRSMIQVPVVDLVHTGFGPGPIPHFER